MATNRRGALGLKVRTGRAAIVVIGRPVETPEILGKTRIDVAFTFEEGAVFHMGQERPLEEARAFIRESEARLGERARMELEAFVRDREWRSSARAW